MNVETLGQRIKRLREARRWTQPYLADLLDVSTKSVSNWETDRNHPRGSMGALRDLFGSALEEVGSPAGDAVEVAIAESELVDWRKDEVRSVYRRNLDQQRNEGGRTG